MEENGRKSTEIKSIKDFVKDGRIDDAVQLIALYLGDSTEDNYIDRLEDIIELLLSIHGGRIVLRFLIENIIIDIPSLLENLSKKDSVLRYTFLLLLKTICENECDLFLPYSEDLLNSEDPNVREADLQLLVYMAGGDNVIDDESLIKTIASKLADAKEFVVEKASQALKAIGKSSSSLVTKILTNYNKEMSDLPEHEDLKNNISDILMSFVTIETIEEIVEAHEKKEDELVIEESEISSKELELRKKELEIKKKKLELGEKEKELEEKAIKEKQKVLKIKEELLEEETKLSKAEIAIIKLPKKKIPKKLIKAESLILDKELELKKKDLEIKMKKLELEEKEKALEEMEILEKEKTLKIKEELIEKEKELSQVELELKQKIIEQKEKKILEEESKRVDKTLKGIEDSEDDNSNS